MTRTIALMSVVVYTIARHGYWTEGSSVNSIGAPALVTTRKTPEQLTLYSMCAIPVSCYGMMRSRVSPLNSSTVDVLQTVYVVPIGLVGVT